MRKTHRLVRGTSADYVLPLLFNGALQPVDGWRFWWTVRGLDGTALLEKSSDAGGIVPHDAQRMRVEIVPADTIGRDTGRYDGDVEAASPGGRREHLERFVLILEPEQTQ